MLLRKAMRWLVFLLLSLPRFASGRVNYCGARMCDHTNSHTFCQYSEGPGSDCKGYIDAALSGEDKIRILVRLNFRRSAAASGKLRGLPTAGNMLKLRWIEDLAREAQRWADQCRPPTVPEEHDSCRDLYAVSVGQCVASVVGEAPGLLPESMVDLWYIQNMHYKANVTAYEISMMRGSNYYGDFAQMVFSYAYMVGCGRSRFMTLWKGRLRTVERLVCNFAPRGPRAGRPIWTPAAPAAACPPRALPDEVLPALCSYESYLDESHDIDYTMTLDEHVLLNAVFEVERNNSLDITGIIDEIFLTKMAIVTIENLVAVTEPYSSLQKRDIINGPISNISDSIRQNKGNAQNLDEMSIKDSIEMTADINKTNESKKVVKQKFNIIGRPKSYNIDELGDIGNNIKANRIEPPELLKTNEGSDIVYGDYEFTEIPEEMNSSVVSIETSPAMQIMENYTTEAHTDEILITIHSASTEDFQSRTSDPVVNAAKAANIFNDIDNDTAEISDKMIADYFSNPETVRQLQDELDRMENSLSMQVPTVTAGKVRRDLREREEQYGEANGNNRDGVDHSPEPYHQQVTQESAKNESNFIDKTPMFNMVMKYMPYLKPYQSQLLQKATSSSSRIIFSTTFEVFLLCFYPLYGVLGQLLFL